jgi:hypothetical protein
MGEKPEQYGESFDVSTGAAPTSASLQERALVAVLCSAFLAVNLLTATWFPSPWCDEIMLLDPAANLYQGRGFTSSAWPSQPSTQFWASYTPLYSVILYGWIGAFGFSALSARSLNYVIVAGVAVLLWLASLRLGLLRRPASRLALVGLLLTGASMMYLARYGRPDALTLLLASATLLASSIRRTRLRSIALFALAMLYPVAGLQLLAFAVAICLLLWLFLGRAFLKTGILLATGSLTGLILLLAFYALHGVMTTFIITQVMSPHVVFGEFGRVVKGDQAVYGRLHYRLETLKSSWQSYLVDPSFIPVLAALLVANAWLLLVHHRLRRSIALFGLVAALFIPPFVLNVGKYSFYYTWMGFVPTALSACRAWEDLASESRFRGVRYVMCLLLLYAGVRGLPWHLYSTTTAQRQEFQRIEDFVRKVIRPDDWVYGDASIYYATKRRGAMFFYSYAYAMDNKHLPEIPEDERRAITVLIVPVDRCEWSAQRVGGRWVPTGDQLILGNATFHEHWEPLNQQRITAEQMDLWKPTLEVYRREDAR